MARYILRRVFHAVFLIAGLLVLTFFVTRLAPGDPSILYLDPGMDPDAVARTRERLGLDDPLWTQFVRWAGLWPPFEGLLQGELGLSFSKHQPVATVLAESIPNTLLLAGCALVVDFALGIALGVYLAFRRGRAIERWLTVSSLVLYSLPSFWFALMLILLFSLGLGWLPASQMFSVETADASFGVRAWDLVRHLILPVCVLALPAAGATARYTRNSMLDVLHQDYVKAAVARGLSAHRVFLRHALPNAVLPLITLFGMSFPFLLSGSVIVETVFAWPGMGRTGIDAIYARDYPVIIGVTLLGGVMVVLGNLLADVLYGWADPRVRLG
jgi:peptide/nickel transport system permease protein